MTGLNKSPPNDGKPHLGTRSCMSMVFSTLTIKYIIIFQTNS